jgi:hypothetical protein
MHKILIRMLLKNLLQAAQENSEARYVKFDELRRTLQYVEANQSSATKPMVFFSSLPGITCSDSRSPCRELRL